MNNEKLPFVSVLVPVKNEEKYIASTIKSLKKQAYPKDKYEILIIDNSSIDNTESEIRKEGMDYNLSTSDRIGRLRNELAKMAKGSILAYIDGDCIAPKDWLYNAISILEKHNVGGAGGCIDGPDDANWVVTGWALKKKPIERETNILATGSFFIKKGVFDEVSGFDENLVAAEDTDISKRIVEAGYKLILSSGLSVIHNGYPSTMKGFIQREIWQTSDYWISRKQGVDPIFIFTFTQTSIIFIFFLCLVLGKYLFALVSLIWFVILIILLSMYKILKSDEKNKIFTFPKVVAVTALYTAGRIVGFLISTSKLLMLKYKKGGFS